MSGPARASAAYRHVCWRYDDPATLHTAARRFLADGLAVGEQVWYVAPGRDEVTGQLQATPALRDARRRGAARFVALDSAYRCDEAVAPTDQVRAYAAATEAALAAGYTGLRVVADATSLVRTPAQVDAFARYEYLVDRYMSGWPMSAMCAYDRRVVGDRTVAELACLHPESNADDVHFRLHAGDPADGHVVLAGELDATDQEAFLTAWSRAAPRPVDGRLVVTATDLRFIDHRCLLHLLEQARSRGAETVLLRGARSAPARLAELLDLPGLHVEPAR